MRGRLSLALLALVVACTPVDDDEPVDDRTCDEATVDVSELSQRMTAQFASPCDVDADCDVVVLGAECPVGSGFFLPDEAIAIDRLDEARAFVASNADEVCLAGTNPEVATCFFPRFDNFYVYAYCDGGTCRGNFRGPDDYCPSLAETVTLSARNYEEILPHPCDADADCVLFTPTFDCPEHELHAEGCPVVLSVDENIDADVAASMESRCREENFACDVVDTCGAVAATCIGGRCAAVNLE